MIINSFRRDLLDKYLTKYSSLMRGKVLDLGGKKKNRRGEFSPPNQNVDSWIYFNNDLKTEPDILGDIHNIDAKDGSFDVVIMTEVLEYLKDPEVVFSEIYRILSNNGIALVSVPFLNPIHGDFWTDRARYTPIKLKELSESAGFQIDSIEEMGSIGAVIFDIIRVAFNYASNRKNRLFKVILRLIKPIFFYIDIISKSQKKYINTGYFIILNKEG